MAAGIWNSSAGIGEANQSLVSKTIEIAAHASAKNNDLIANPVMQQILARDQGLGPLLAALGVSFYIADIGQATAATTAEGTEASATNFDGAPVTLTPARKEFRRIVSDYGRALNQSLISGDGLSPEAMALLTLEGYKVWGNTLVNDIVALASSATYNTGTTGQDLTWNAMHHLTIDMRDRGSRGGIVAAITAKGLKDLSDDTMSLGGAVSMSAQVQQFLNGAGEGAFVGRFFGGLDLYLNSELDADGGDTLGIAFSAGGIMTKHERVPLPPEATGLVDAGFFRQELRRPGGAVTSVSTDMYLAVGIREQVQMAKIVYVTA